MTLSHPELEAQKRDLIPDYLPDATPTLPTAGHANNFRKKPKKKKKKKVRRHKFVTSTALPFLTTTETPWSQRWRFIRPSWDEDENPPHYSPRKTSPERQIIGDEFSPPFHYGKVNTLRDLGDGKRSIIAGITFAISLGFGLCFSLRGKFAPEFVVFVTRLKFHGIFLGRKNSGDSGSSFPSVGDHVVLEVEG